MIDRAGTSDCLTVFSGRHLPVRDDADDDLLRLALDVVASHDECVFGEVVRGDPQLKDAFAPVPGDEEWVAEWMRDRSCRPVALGPYPPFLSDVPEDAIDGIIPGADGPIVVAAY